MLEAWTRSEAAASVQAGAANAQVNAVQQQLAVLREDRDLAWQRERETTAALLITRRSRARDRSTSCS